MTSAAVLTEASDQQNWAGFSAWAFGQDWWRAAWLSRMCPDGEGDETAEARWFGQFALSATGCM